MITVPEPLAAAPWAPRLHAALRAAESAAAALVRLRGARLVARETGAQLKTAVDEAAEAWVLALLRGDFPEDVFLAEEAFDRAGETWDPAPAYWTVDALDGTRSYAEGYDGFCVQLAYVTHGVPRLGVVYEPAMDACYLAAEGSGAWRVDREGYRRLRIAPAAAADRDGAPVWVDSIRPEGALGDLFRRWNASFLECGSVGLKVCRVADGSADLLLKHFAFKLWDVAPGEVILREAGGRLGLWSGAPVPYDTPRVRFTGLLAAPEPLFTRAAGAAPCNPVAGGD